MSHRRLASVWAQLQGRVDVDNILREIIGEYTLKESACFNDPRIIRTNALQFISNLKIIFDFHRTSLVSPSHSTPACPPPLRFDTLFSAILLLLKLKSDVFKPPHNFVPSYEADCGFIAQTLFSGLRALLLFSSASDRDCRIIQIKFSKAWENEEFNDHDDMLVNYLCRSMVKELCHSSCSQFHDPACGKLELLEAAHGGASIPFGNVRASPIANWSH